MKKILQLLIIALLLFPFNLQFERNEVIEQLEHFEHLSAPIDSIDLINPFDECFFEHSETVERFERLEQFFSSVSLFRFERNEVVERFGRLKQFLLPLDLINLVDPISVHPETTQCHSERSEESPAGPEARKRIDPFSRFSPINLINLINSINQNTAWSQSSQEEDTPTGTNLPKNYVIGSGDVLEIFVWRNEQLSREVVVRPDGKISLPLLQDAQAEGLTVPWLKEEITRRFGEYLENPRVTVIVKQIGSYRVSVLGRVMRPGVYPITGETTLVEAISMAGGFTEWANKRKITVITTEGGEETKLTVNYKKIASGKDPSQNIVLKRGDTIIVP